MTIGSALDDYMANLANKHQESERKIAVVENKSRLVQQEKSKLVQQLKERDKKINDLEMQLRQIDNDLAIGRKKLEKAATDLMLANKSKWEAEESNSRQLEKELKETKAKLASTEAKPIPSQIDTPKPPPELVEVAKLLRTLLSLK